MHLRPRFLTIAAAYFAGGVTILTILVPSVHIAYRNVPLHATLETSVAMIALLAAYLACGRFLHTRRLADLLLLIALGILAVANLLFSAVPWSLLNASSPRLSGWTALLASLGGAGLLAVSSFAPKRTVKRPARWLAAGLVFAG